MAPAQVFIEGKLARSKSEDNFAAIRDHFSLQLKLTSNTHLPRPYTSLPQLLHTLLTLTPLVQSQNCITHIHWRIAVPSFHALLFFVLAQTCSSGPAALRDRYPIFRGPPSHELFNCLGENSSPLLLAC